MKIRYRAQALADITEIHRYIEERSPERARHVLQAIRDGISLIVEQPRAAVRTDDPSVRVIIVRLYRYKVFYTIVDSETVEILHVRHTSRAPWGCRKGVRVRIARSCKSMEYFRYICASAGSARLPVTSETSILK